MRRNRIFLAFLPSLNLRFDIGWSHGTSAVVLKSRAAMLWNPLQPDGHYHITDFKENC